MTQKERQERSKKEILTAALEEFGSQDYDKVTMERICANHGISKGMMYHYYSNKDELFLLCVKDTFDELKAYVESVSAEFTQQNTFDAVENYFTIREYFFEQYPQRKRIFETAILHPPKHLTEQIHILHEPMMKLNRQFIEKIVAQMPLREGLNADCVTRYLESMEPVLQSVICRYLGNNGSDDLYSMLESTREILDLLLFGVLRQK